MRYTFWHTKYHIFSVGILFQLAIHPTSDPKVTNIYIYKYIWKTPQILSFCLILNKIEYNFKVRNKDAGFLCWLCSKLIITLRKICDNKCFRLPGFSRIRTESATLSLYGIIRDTGYGITLCSARKTSKWSHFGVFTANVKHIQNKNLVLLLLTLNNYLPGENAYALPNWQKHVSNQSFFLH